MIHTTLHIVEEFVPMFFGDGNLRTGIRLATPLLYGFRGNGMMMRVRSQDGILKPLNCIAKILCRVPWSMIACISYFVRAETKLAVNENIRLVQEDLVHL